MGFEEDRRHVARSPKTGQEHRLRAQRIDLHLSGPADGFTRREVSKFHCCEREEALAVDLYQRADGFPLTPVHSCELHDRVAVITLSRHVGQARVLNCNSMWSQS